MVPVTSFDLARTRRLVKSPSHQQTIGRSTVCWSSEGSFVKRAHLILFAIVVHIIENAVTCQPSWRLAEDQLGAKGCSPRNEMGYAIMWTIIPGYNILLDFVVVRSARNARADVSLTMGAEQRVGPHRHRYPSTVGTGTARPSASGVGKKAHRTTRWVRVRRWKDRKKGAEK
ncbi:K02106 MFS transporter, ATOE family, short-chain fatty acids transporter [Anopheles sinensis]|uniref:K02106 MFS transporter, ATOE family, short-chain fatty acids transporter n=1 Tax=Anopheles sinensis TaxID=74873 RepID=A0A084W1D1_ANOSI|nr:K02106 MFS transporter, ATOE family, short-chain fatty acids transporter [Anopheles sinensis]